MKEKRGYTLIELLAVIVILAIIALIATPIILNMINDAKKSAAIDSAYGYIESIEYQNSMSILNSTKYPVVTSNDVSIINGQINLKGTRPTSGTVTITNRRVTEANLCINNYSIHYNGTKATIEGNYCGENGSGSEVINSKSFAEDDWETIQKVVKSGKADDYYDVGDTKEIDFGGEEVLDKPSSKHTVRIANMSPCTNGETSETACGFVVEFADIVTFYRMPYGVNNKEGWPASAMRTHVKETIYSELPDELKEVIADTKVISGGGNGGEEIVKSTDKLYLLSPKEIFNNENENDTATAKTRQLDYYANKGVTSSNPGGAVKRIFNTTNSIWWLRSAYSSSETCFFTIGLNGDYGWNDGSAYYNIGISPAFRIE